MSEHRVLAEPSWSMHRKKKISDRTKKGRASKNGILRIGNEKDWVVQQALEAKVLSYPELDQPRLG